MKLSQLDNAICQRNYRRNTLKMREHAEHGHLRVTLGVDLDPATQIALEPVRAALVKALNDHVANCETQLKELGVELD